MFSINGFCLCSSGNALRAGGVAAVAVLLLGTAASFAPVPHEAFEDRWVLDKEQSSPVGPWSTLALEVEVEESRVIIAHHWSTSHHAATDSMTIETGGAVNRVPIDRWLDNRHLGVSVRGTATRRVTAEWLDDGRTLQVVSRFPVHTSQGETSVRILSEYRLSPDLQSLSLLQLRSTRPKPIRYTFQRAEEEDA